MTFILDAAVRKELRKPFPEAQIGKLPATQKRPALDFVGHAAVTDRLNAHAPDWFYTVDEETDHGGVCWIRGTFTVGGVSRVEYGDGKDPKEAIGNFIRRGAMRFGVAIDLWSREELDWKSSDIEPAPSRVIEGSRGGGMVDEDGSGAPASGPASGESASVGEGAAGSSDRTGDDTPGIEGEGEHSQPALSTAGSPSSVEQRKDFRAYLAERYGTAQALLMARSLFQTGQRKIPNMTVLDLDELQAVDVELKARKLEAS